MGSMKNTFNKLVKGSRAEAKRYADFEDLLFAGKQQYHNTAVQAANAETHALRFALEEMYTLIQEQARTIADQQMQINDLKNQMMRGMRNREISVTQEVVTTTITTSTGRQPKWTKEKIFREFDMYRREHALMSNITPAIVRNNWSTLYTATPKYTGMTLGELLSEYAMERGINY
ncbi:hypothetical protein D3C76_718410 [compost metagenome]